MLSELSSSSSRTEKAASERMEISSTASRKDHKDDVESSSSSEEQESSKPAIRNANKTGNSDNASWNPRTSRPLTSIVASTRSMVTTASSAPVKLPFMVEEDTQETSYHEIIFVVSAGLLLSFNSGYINGSCLSGFLTPYRNGDGGRNDVLSRSVSGFTSTYTNSALALAEHGAFGENSEFGVAIGMIFSFYVGATIAGFLTPRPLPYRIEPTYGPTFLLGAASLFIASVLAATGHEKTWFFNLAAIANGIQNGISSSYSANLIRTTGLTGTTTDIGLISGRILRGNLMDLWKMLLLIGLTFAFWLGGIVSFYSTRYFTIHSLLFNAGLFSLIGLSLILFLEHELDLTASEAVMGTWDYKETMDRLDVSRSRKSVDLNRVLRPSLHELSHQFNLDRSEKMVAGNSERQWKIFSDDTAVVVENGCKEDCKEGEEASTLANAV